MTIKSVYEDQDDILRSIIALHCPDGFECDMTYGNGGFYKNIPGPRHRFDIDPQVEGVVEASSCALPLESSSISSAVFDPPFLTYVKQAREHGSIMAKRFGGYWRYDELEQHYRLTLEEAARVLRKKGILIFKCQDIIHNHSMHCTHHNVICWGAQSGFRLKDLFILPAKHRMPMPAVSGAAPRRQKHARIHHSYFLVLEKCP